MPQITIKGLTDKQMRAISTPLIPKLAEAIGCPEDWLILELARSKFLLPEGNRCPVSPLWDRCPGSTAPSEVQGACGKVFFSGIPSWAEGYPLGTGDLHHPLSGAVLRIRSRSQDPKRRSDGWAALL